MSQILRALPMLFLLSAFTTPSLALPAVSLWTEASALPITLNREEVFKLRMNNVRAITEQDEFGAQLSLPIFAHWVVFRTKVSTLQPPHWIKNSIPSPGKCDQLASDSPDSGYCECRYISPETETPQPCEIEFKINGIAHTFPLTNETHAVSLQGEVREISVALVKGGPHARIFLSATAQTDEPRPHTGTTAAAEPFYLQLDQLNHISNFVERRDLGRLIAIQNAIKNIIKDMAENLEAGREEVTFKTLRRIESIIIQYRFSKSFFGWSSPRSPLSIYNEHSKVELERLRDLQEDLMVTYGYEAYPYSIITASSFRQIQRLLQQLEEFPIDAQLKSELRERWRLIGEVIAIAEQGDRPLAFAKATQAVDNLRQLYPQFDEFSTINAAFPLIMEIQGLIEFYADYAQNDLKREP